MSRYCVVLLLAVLGCGAEPLEPLHPAADAVSRGGNANQTPGDGALAGRKLVYRAELSVVVSDFDAAERGLKTALAEAGGLVAQAQQGQHPGKPKTGRWVLRVRAERFDAALDAVAALGIAERREVTIDDVTSAWVDHEARLTSWKKMEQRLLGLVDTHTGGLKDLLTVEEELNRVRSEIEKLEARQRALADQVTLATIIVALREDREFLPPPAPTFTAQLQSTFQQSCRVLRQTGQGLALAFAALIPWLLLAALVLAGPLWWWRSRLARG